MSIFNIYAFVDYSGGASPGYQKKNIALSILNNGNYVKNTKGFTRETIRIEIQSLLLYASKKGKRVIFGFDHSYSFPIGFYETVTSKSWDSWDQLLKLVCIGTKELPPINDDPREWAKICNKLIHDKTGISTNGPFWGPHFKSQIKNPRFPFENTKLKEKRIAEEQCKSTKPIYKIGGNGAVGLQSLFGISHLARLRNYCKINGIKLSCWPFDGWEMPSDGHVMVEIYPRLFNKGKKGDIEDAFSCSSWLKKQDEENILKNYFSPNLNEKEKERASLEGWIIGVK